MPRWPCVMPVLRLGLAHGGLDRGMGMGVTDGGERVVCSACCSAVEWAVVVLWYSGGAVRCLLAGLAWQSACAVGPHSSSRLPHTATFAVGAGLCSAAVVVTTTGHAHCLSGRLAGLESISTSTSTKPDQHQSDRTGARTNPGPGLV